MLERIRVRLPELSAAERKVAELALAQPYTVMQAAVADIAASAGVSQPTVIRFCRSMGCAGLPDFKLKLAASLVTGVPYVHSSVRPEDPTSEIAAKVFDNTVSALIKCRNEVNPQAIDQAVELLRSRYATHGIALETVVPDGLPMVECHEVQIEQVLVNLLNNAFDAIDGDPRSQPWVQVRVSMQPASDADGGVDAARGAAAVRIDVLDGGPGVSPENRARLMETFFTTKPRGAGIGIGLSVSQTIAQDHGGTLELLDAEGPTCFRLTLPVLTPHPTEGASA